MIALSGLWARGVITEGGRQGVAIRGLMALTEHRSVAQAIGYFQAGEITHNPAARLLDGDAEPAR